MPQVYFRSAKTTSIKFDWPSSITGIERVMLCSEGILQKQLSAFFSSPIDVETAYSYTKVPSASDYSAGILSDPSSISEAVATASEDMPVVQARKVLINCEGRTVVTAISNVKVKSPRAAKLLLEKKFAIGQLFRELGTSPSFELMSVGLGHTYDFPEVAVEKTERVPGEEPDALWRVYRLSAPEFETDILEVFPSRKMFVQGADWLSSKSSANSKRRGSFKAFRSIFSQVF